MPSVSVFPAHVASGRELPPAGRHSKRQPHQSRVCQETQGGTLGGAQKAPVGFQQGEVHSSVGRRPGAGEDTARRPVGRRARAGVPGCVERLLLTGHHTRRLEH